MSLVATNPSALRASFESLIKNIVPQHVPYRDYSWHALASTSEVVGTFRGFFLQFRPGVQVPEGPAIFSSIGSEYIAPLRIWTCYADLSPGADQSILTEDQADLYGTLQAATGTVPGLISAGAQEPFAFADTDSEDFGGVVGHYTFLITYMQRYR